MEEEEENIEKVKETEEVRSSKRMRTRMSSKKGKSNGGEGRAERKRKSE